MCLYFLLKKKTSGIYTLQKFLTFFGKKMVVFLHVVCEKKSNIPLTKAFVTFEQPSLVCYLVNLDKLIDINVDIFE